MTGRHDFDPPLPLYPPEGLPPDRVATLLMTLRGCADEAERIAAGLRSKGRVPRQRLQAAEQLAMMAREVRRHL